MLHQPRLLHHGTATVENHEVWDAAYVEPCCHLRTAFSIKLYDNSSSRHMSSGTLNFWCCHPTRSAPRGPEIHEHRDPGIVNDSLNNWESTSSGSSTGGNGVLQTPHFSVSARCATGMRFFRPQPLQVLITGIAPQTVHVAGEFNVLPRRGHLPLDSPLGCNCVAQGCSYS